MGFMTPCFWRYPILDLGWDSTSKFKSEAQSGRPHGLTAPDPGAGGNNVQEAPFLHFMYQLCPFLEVFSDIYSGPSHFMP